MNKKRSNVIYLENTKQAKDVEERERTITSITKKKNTSIHALLGLLLCVDEQENGKSTNTLSSSRLPSNFSPSSLGCAYRRRSEFSLSPLYLFSTYCSSTNLFVPSSLSTSDRVNNEWSLSLLSLVHSLPRFPDDDC